MVGALLWWIELSLKLRKINRQIRLENLNRIAPSWFYRIGAAFYNRFFRKQKQYVSDSVEQAP